MQLDLKKMPFGRRLSRHVIYEETDNQNNGWDKGLYLAFANEGSSSFIGGPLLGPKGFNRITPTCEGADLDYKYEATPFMLTMTTNKGGARFVFDGTKVLRIEGKGIGLRLNGKLGFGGNCLETSRGIEYTMGGAIYLIKALKGKMTLDCHWNLKALKVTDPILYIEPDESGVFELAIFDTDDTYEMPEISESLEKCAAGSEADYNSFTALLKLPPFDFGFGTNIDYAVYSIWTGFIEYKGNELCPPHKLGDLNIHTLEQAALALSFKDGGKALDILSAMLSFSTPQGMVPTWLGAKQNLDEAVPPLYAYTVSCLLNDKSLDNIALDTLITFYYKMAKAISWWYNNRKNEKGQCFYAYRHELGWPGTAEFSLNTPLVTPDLAALLALGAESLSMLAEGLGKQSEAEIWSEFSKSQLEILTKTLWDGKGFICIDAATCETAPFDGMPALIPLLLGKRLPGDMLSALSEKVKNFDWSTLPIIPASLIIAALKLSGRDTDAGKAAMELLAPLATGGINDARGKNISAGTFYSPAACAALLALGSSFSQL